MCTSPITIVLPRSKRVNPYFKDRHAMTVPCGKCAECVKSKQLSWCVRMLEQYKDTPISLFVTLTYRPEKVPLSVDVCTGDTYLTVCKPHVQKWIKRMKIRLTRQGRDFKKRPLQYFLTSEYGMKPKSRNMYRPHYHAVFFGLTLEEALPSLQEWKDMFGYVNYSVPRNDYACARYVGKYCCKGSLFENPLIAEGKVLPTFHLISHGLGAGYLKRMDGVFKRNPYAEPIKKLTANQYRTTLSYYYSERYVEFVADNLYYHDSRIFDKYGNKAFKIKLPKYYKDRILGRSIYVVQPGSSRGKKVYVKSLLAYQVAFLVEKRRNEEFDSKFRHVVGKDRESASAEEISSFYDSERRALEEREKQSRDALLRFYKKSKL